MTYDTIIRNGRWFDGTGAPSAVRNIGIIGGRVAVRTGSFLRAGRRTPAINPADKELTNVG